MCRVYFKRNVDIHIFAPNNRGELHDLNVYVSVSQIWGDVFCVDEAEIHSSIRINSI